MSLFFNYIPYIAVIGDIVASKKLEDRKTVQEKLQSVLSDINKKYGHEIAAKFMITLGDEFQGLLHIGTHILEIIDKIEREMYPISIRFGLGIGEITTAIQSDFPFGADGPAYYNARKMINELKVMEKRKMEAMSKIKIEIADHVELSDLMNAIFSLNTVLKEKWTDRQREIINAYLTCEGTQSDVARTLGIHQSNVQKALSGANFYTYQNALNTLTKILSNVKEAQDV